ncbi:MAG TPA: ATP-binding protein [Tepidisphaeraceae bacterium]|nr:ATP-binding protein [Tepidisphaeraceae bacterium]
MHLRSNTKHGLWFSQLDWFIRLRWMAGAIVALCGWADYRWTHWFAPSSLAISALGIGILIYNVALRWSLHSTKQPRDRRRFLMAITWAQLLLDMICLTVLVLLTGKLRSPLTPFFVLHMVIASLLLPRRMAYTGALAMIALYGTALWLTNSFPVERADRLLTAGRAATLLIAVHLANHITSSLRRQHRRVVRQNRRIRAMSQQLKQQQDAMIQHQKMVAMGQMAAGVTHEIANPLASMDSLLQLMQRKADSIRPDAVVTLREQIARINQIIQQMKAFAHPAEMQQATADLNEVVEQSLHMLRFDPRLKQTQIDRQYSEDAGSLSFLPQALQQVLVNLIINALDAMAQTSQPRLTICTRRNEGWCFIDVSDNGCGIEPDHLGRLFEPFFTTKPVGKGTGLGLSISYTLIQKQAGSISVRSQVKAGTTFTIRLPVATDTSRNRETTRADGWSF